MIKKSLVISILSLTLIAFFSLSNVSSQFFGFDEQSNLEDTSGILGEIHSELKTYPFPEAVKESDLIADITISKTISELNEPMKIPKTIYSANVNDVIKGDENLKDKEIFIMQQGNSQWIFNDNTLFEENDNYILFLKKSNNFEESYWILGEETGMFKIIENDIAIKKSLYDTELEAIEINNKEIYIKANEISDLKDFQILDKNLLKDKIISEKNLSSN